MEMSKKPDRLYCSNKVKQLLEKMYEINYMGLGKGITRSELFLFAMSLGVESKTETEVISPIGLILDKSIDSTTIALMYSQFIYSLKDPDNDLDTISDLSKVYKTAQQYANTGFEMIEDYLNTKKQEDLMWELFDELDQQYEEIV